VVLVKGVTKGEGKHATETNSMERKKRRSWLKKKTSPKRGRNSHRSWWKAKGRAQNYERNLPRNPSRGWGTKKGAGGENEKKAGTIFLKGKRKGRPLQHVANGSTKKESQKNTDRWKRGRGKEKGREG